MRDPIPRTDLERRLQGERRRGVTALQLVASTTSSLVSLFGEGIATTNERQALVTHAVRASEILARAEILAEMPEPDPDDFAIERVNPRFTLEQYKRAQILSVPVESLEDHPEIALSNVARGDYDLTWHQAACVLGMIERYRDALEKIANGQPTPGAIAQAALDADPDPWPREHAPDCDLDEDCAPECPAFDDDPA